ncbi:MAG: hypothetical protein HYZ48_03595 [Chlamydiales bacterium]|nr:hypothetical protein [Chlamydiales bacterium]
MFAVIYQGYIKPGQEMQYKEAWEVVASYFIKHRGSIRSSLHKTADGGWIAYSRWPDKKTKEASWSIDVPLEEFPSEIATAIRTIKACMDTDRGLLEQHMEVVKELF